MKNEDKTTPLEKLGYGLKYTLIIAFTILAICALCFIFISITTYFAPPLQPMFDQERLGQLGDFLGGTLNPIFGFATICLLLWSIFIQRKELSLTRDELKNTSIALSGQLALAKNEYSRKQLQEHLNILEKDYEEIFTSTFEDIYISDREMEAGSVYDKFNSLLVFHYLVHNEKDKHLLNEIDNAIPEFKIASKEDNIEKMIAESTKHMATCWRMYIVVQKYKSLTLELISMTISKSIALLIAEDLSHKLRQCQKIGIISRDYATKIELIIKKRINNISTEK